MVVVSMRVLELNSYETDVVAWAKEQAKLIRAGRFDLLDIDHIAEAIEDVGKSEQRELATRMALLLAHLLKWAYQPDRQTASWQRTIREQRKGIKKRLARSPGLQPVLIDADWQAEIWADAVALAANETGLADFPDSCEWCMLDEVLQEDWFPANHRSGDCEAFTS